MTHRMTKEQLMDWAADHYDTEQNCEGTPNEALMAGWVNAMYMEEAGQIESDDRFVEVAYSEYENMGYHRAA